MPARARREGPKPTLRGNVYWARFWHQGTLVQESLHTRDPVEAARKLTELVTAIEASASGRKTFNDLAELFWTEHCKTLKPQSARRYGLSIKALAQTFEMMPLDEITSQTMAEFERMRRDEGVSNPTIRRDLACLSSMFSMAEVEEWVESNPVGLFLRRRARRGLTESPPRQRWLTLEEEKAMLGEVTKEVRTAMVLAIDTGLRRDELLGLKWPEVDLRHEVLRLPASRTKSSVGRMVPLIPRAVETLKMLQLRRRPGAEWVLTNPRTGKRYRHVNRGLKNAARRLGLDDMHWHDLRRTAGCRFLIEHDMSIHEVSRILGHSTVTQTERAYAFLDMETVRKRLRKRMRQDDEQG